MQPAHTSRWSLAPDMPSVWGWLQLSPSAAGLARAPSWPAEPLLWPFADALGLEVAPGGPVCAWKDRLRSAARQHTLARLHDTARVVAGHEEQGHILHHQQENTRETLLHRRLTTTECHRVQLRVAQTVRGHC